MGGAMAHTEERADLATPKEDLVQVIFGICLMAGGATDGWAHNNILGSVQEDGFFTPWHGLLYTGFALSAAWTVLLAYRRRHLAARWWLNGWPAGYKLGAVGIGLFMIGGLGDMVWHETLGVEVSIDALLSPSHLLLAIGSTLLLSSAVRSWWTAGGGGQRVATGILSMGLAVTNVSLFLLYGLSFDSAHAAQAWDGARGAVGHTIASHGLASYIVTTGIFVVPVLMILRRGSVFGATTALVTMSGLFHMSTREFEFDLTAGVAGSVLAALLADAIIVRLDRVRGVDAPFRLPLAGMLVGALVTAGHLIGLALSAGVQWPAELWSGIPISCAAVGAMLGGIAARPATYPAQLDEAVAQATVAEAPEKVAAA
jgi:hypothetical protein